MSVFVFTARSIGPTIEADPRRWVLAIVALHALLSVTTLSDKAAASPMGAMRLAFAVGAVLGPLLGLLFFVIRTRLVYWAGRALGGRALWVQIRAADAWSSVPWMFLALPLLPLAILRSMGESSITLVVLTRDLLELVAGLLNFALPLALGYTGLLFTLVLAEVQQFSVWRALLNQVLAFMLAIALPGAGIALGYGLNRLFG